jgi:ABC-2 type transport system ATP-binding protein
LDPQGVAWLRGLLRTYAAEGRAVLVSSHLLAEMQLLADHLIVIGRGRLIADEPVERFVRRGLAHHVRVRSPQAVRLADVLTAEGAVVEWTGDDRLTVAGVSARLVGDMAQRHGLPLHELVGTLPSLEEAFLELTGGAVEYAAAAVGSAELAVGAPAGRRVGDE